MVTKLSIAQFLYNFLNLFSLLQLSRKVLPSFNQVQQAHKSRGKYFCTCGKYKGIYLALLKSTKLQMIKLI